MEVLYFAVAGGVAGGIGLCWGAKKIYDLIKIAGIIREVERDGWTHIGTVKFLCVYPIDGGRGLELDKANFMRSGFQSLPDITEVNSRIHLDRCFVIFDKNFNPLRANLYEPQVSLKCDKDEAVASLWRTLKIVASTFQVGSTLETILYLDREMKVKLANTNIRDQVKMAYKIERNNLYEIGFYSPPNRIQFNETARNWLEANGDPDCHLSNFSSCTMINTKSIKHLQNATGRADLSHKNFRPQIVFEGKRPYIEENVRSIKIGNLEFHNVRPCTHDENINMNYEPQIANENSILSSFFRGNRTNRISPFRYLTRHRPLSRSGSAAFQNLNNPVFGINFHFEPREMDENGLVVIDVRETEDPSFFTIVKGQEIYARFNPPRSNLDDDDMI